MTPLVGQRLGGLRVDERAEQAEERLAAPQPRRPPPRTAWRRAGSRRHSRVQLVGRDDRRAGFLVRGIGDGRAGAGAALDEDVEPGRLELAEHFGYQGDAPLSGRGLLGDTDLHGHHLDLGSVRAAERGDPPGTRWGRRDRIPPARPRLRPIPGCGSDASRTGCGPFGWPVRVGRPGRCDRRRSYPWPMRGLRWLCVIAPGRRRGHHRDRQRRTARRAHAVPARHGRGGRHASRSSPGPSRRSPSGGSIAWPRSSGPATRTSSGARRRRARSTG